MAETYHDKLPELLVNLLKGVIYRDDNPERWQVLMNLQGQAMDYLKVIGMDLMIYEDEGFAYLKNIDTDEEDNIPRLISRRPLSYPVSLLLAQLRRKLAEHDASSSEERLILDRQEITDLMATFLTHGTNEVQFIRKVESYIHKVYELGFLRYLGKDREKIEVKRLIKPFVDNQWLNEFEERMKEYTEYSGESEE